MESATLLDYPSDELDAMARARNYYRWILNYWRPHLGRFVVEFGAGIGTVSAHLLGEQVERLFVVEPAPALAKRLEDRFCGDRRVTVVRGVLADARREVKDYSVDSVVSVNVLEHIDDDVATLRAAFDILVPGGRLMAFVPAFQWLYGSLDRTFGHVRRYTRGDLVTKLRAVG